MSRHQQADTAEKNRSVNSDSLPSRGRGSSALFGVVSILAVMFLLPASKDAQINERFGEIARQPREAPTALFSVPYKSTDFVAQKSNLQLPERELNSNYNYEFLFYVLSKENSLQDLNHLTLYDSARMYHAVDSAISKFEHLLQLNRVQAVVTKNDLQPQFYSIAQDNRKQVIPSESSNSWVLVYIPEESQLKLVGAMELFYHNFKFSRDTEFLQRVVDVNLLSDSETFIAGQVLLFPVVSASLGFQMLMGQDKAFLD